MRITVIGGTGLVGRVLVRLLRDGGHAVVAASPTTGVSTITRLGLADALAGADVVVDVSDAPSYDDDEVLDYFMTSGRHLAAGEADAGVSHHVVLSVVGADRLPGSGYMRAKVAQERLVRAAGTPYTIVRSTESFELMRSAADAATYGDIVRISPALVQPIAARDISSGLAEIATSAPAGDAELAGPEPLRLAEVAERMLRAHDDPRRVEADPRATYHGSQLDDRTLMPASTSWLGSTRLDDWLLTLHAGHGMSGPAPLMRRRS